MLKIRYDCRAFSTLPDFQKQYTVVVRNWFQVLGDVEDPKETHEIFIEANQLATKKCVPVKENARRTLLSKHPSVVEAREHWTRKWI